MSLDGTWYIGRVDTDPVPWWVQRGVNITKVVHTDDLTIDINLRVRRGPFGWPARRWLRDNQIEWSANLYRGDEWEHERGTVLVKPGRTP